MRHDSRRDNLTPLVGFIVGILAVTMMNCGGERPPATRDSTALAPPSQAPPAPTPGLPQPIPPGVNPATLSAPCVASIIRQQLYYRIDGAPLRACAGQYPNRPGTPLPPPPRPRVDTAPAPPPKPIDTTPTPPPPRPPPPGGINDLRSCANEPRTLPLVSAQPFTGMPPHSPEGSVRDEAGWFSYRPLRNLAITQPVGEDDPVLTGTWPQGFRDGAAPYSLAVRFPAAKIVYLCVRYRLDARFTFLTATGGQGPTKFGFWKSQGGGMNHFQFLQPHAGLTAQHSRRTINGVLWTSTNYCTNARAAKGAFHTYEYLIENTATLAPSTAKVWVDGRLVCTNNNVLFLGPGEGDISELRIEPTYGGRGRDAPYAMTLDVDFYRVRAQ